MKRHKIALFVAGCLALLIVSILSFNLISARPAGAQSASTATPTAPTDTVPPVTAGQGTVAALEGRLQEIYRRVNPSVVHIQTVGGGPAEGEPEILQFPFPGPLEPQQPQIPQRSTGSGFLWDEAGHIVTNFHVIEGAERIYVTFSDGTKAEGEVVGTDPQSDLAVLKVDRPQDELPAAVEVADSTELAVGQLAIAIGSPFSQNGTMTVGIISALGRLLPLEVNQPGGGRFSIPDVIQTDAAINPGNSGGVLLNERGQLIGVTTAIISPARASAGIGFAIPSAIVQRVIPALIEDGEFKHPFIGISGTTLTPQLAEEMGLEPTQRGALVIDVMPEGPADEAGVQGSARQIEIDGESIRVGGDLIVAINGEPIQDFDDLVAYLAHHTRVGEEITLTVLREGEEVELPLTLAARPEPTSVSQSRQEASQGARLGVYGVDVTPEIAELMSLPANQRGVLVQQVENGSPAAEAGIRGSFKPVTIDGQQLLIGGDVIVAFDGEPIANLDELRARLRQVQPGEEATLTLLREGEEVEVELTLAAPGRSSR